MVLVIVVVMSKISLFFVISRLLEKESGLASDSLQGRLRIDEEDCKAERFEDPSDEVNFRWMILKQPECQ